MSRMKTAFLITGLILLLIANIVMVFSHREGFADAAKPADKKKEGFMNYFLENAGASGLGAHKFEPIGPFDNVKLSGATGIPNLPLSGSEFQPGPDSLFIFKNNQVKPECCASSYSSDTGCVCTTPQQRNFINMRGGNRTMEDGI